MELLASVTCFLCLIIVILLIYDYYNHNNRRGRFIAKIPGPRALPLIGNFFDLIVPLEQLWQFLRTIEREYYPVNKFWIVNWPVINIRHPDDIEIMLTTVKNTEKSLFYDLLHPWLNDGLLTSKGEKWKNRRKILTPAFHFNVLQEFVDTFVEHTDRLVKTLQAETKYGEVVKELLPLTSSITLGTILETAMGATWNEKDPAQKEYRSSVYDIGRIFYYRITRPWIKSDWIFSLTAKGQEQAKALKTLHGFSTKIIKDRQQYHRDTKGKYLEEFSETSEKQENIEKHEQKNPRKRLAFLDLLIAASKKSLGIDDEGIREEVDTFVFEGHDTTAMAMFFTIILLAEHKDIQARARKEINEVFKETGEQLSINAVQKLSYLDRCIKEALRLYPSVPSVSRKITEDMQLKHCFVPAGSILNVHIFDCHRDPNFWPCPNIYDPDRFLPEQSIGRHPFSYVPFSAGPRNCIGQKFAMLELKTVIAGLLRNFYFEAMETAANIRILPDLVIRCAHPVNVKFVSIIK